jgi:hypothetical protein
VSDEEPDLEEAPPNDSATVAQQTEILYGKSNDNNISKEYNNVKLSPLDYVTLDVLQLCHDAGVNLAFYDILFALLRKHSNENNVDITKLPKRETFLKSLRAQIASPQPIISQVGSLQVPHFDMLHQIRDLLGSFIFSPPHEINEDLRHPRNGLSFSFPSSSWLSYCCSPPHEINEDLRHPRRGLSFSFPSSSWLSYCCSPPHDKNEDLRHPCRCLSFSCQ